MTWKAVKPDCCADSRSMAIHPALAPMKHRLLGRRELSIVRILLPGRQRVVIVREVPRKLFSRLDAHGVEGLYRDVRADRPQRDVRERPVSRDTKSNADLLVFHSDVEVLRVV